MTKSFSNFTSPIITKKLLSNSMSYWSKKIQNDWRITYDSSNAKISLVVIVIDNETC